MMNPNYIFRVYHKGAEQEYTQYEYYVLEAKLVLADNIVVSVMTETVS